MFPQVLRATFQGLIQWPDLMFFGLLAFVLSIALDAVMTPLWADYARRALSAPESASILPAVLLLVIQQVVLTFGSMLIVTAATRVVLARLAGGSMTVIEGLRLKGRVRPVATYSAVYAAISTAIALLYLFLLFGALGISFAGAMTTTGIAGLTQVPTSMVGGSTGLILLVFVPLLLAWALANTLVAPVIAEEGFGGATPIRRSWFLVLRTWSVLVGLFATILAFSCVLSLLISYFVQPADTLSGVPDFTSALPQLPVVLSAFLSAVVFVIGAIFNSAWYRAAIEETTRDANIRM